MKRIVRAVVALLAALLVVPLLGAAPAGAALPAPSPITPTPGNNLVTGNTVFTWTSVTGAVRYHFQLSTSNAFAGTLYDVFTANTNATPPLDQPLGTMYWRVSSIDANNVEGPFSSTAQFTKIASPAPTPTSPPDNATFDFPTQPVVFSWQPVAGAKRYQLEIGNDPLFTPPLAFSASTVNTTYALPDTQAIGQTYYWRVRAYSLGDFASQDSAVRSYKTTWSSVPQLTFPPDTNNPPIEEVVLQWNPVPGAVNYDLQISPDINFNSNVLNVTVKSTRYSPGTTLNNGAYFWRVRARNANFGLSGYSTVRTFTRAWPANPGAGQTPTPQWSTSTTITLLTPANGASGVTLPTFSWTPERLASQYEIQMSTDPNFGPGQVVNCFTNHTTYTPYQGCGVDPTPNGAVYYWRVHALDGPLGVNGLFSAVSSFSYIPNLVTPVAPANGTTTGTPVLQWSVPTDATGSYHVVWSTTGNIQTADTFNTMFVPQNLVSGSTYTWYVQTRDLYGRLGPIPGWSRTFIYQAPATGASVTLNAPVATEAANVHPPLLTWSAVTNATRYEVWVRKTGDLVFFQVPSGTITTNGYAHTGDDLLPQQYDYIVRAFDSGNVNIVTSGVGTFTINPLPNSAPVSPANCPPSTSCPSEPDTPTLKWARVPSASNYIVTLAADPNFTNVITTYITGYNQLTPRESLKDSQAGQATYWYARPCYGNRCGPGPETLNGNPPVYAFRKQSYPVEPISPANNATINDQITFAWKDFLLSNQNPAGVGQAPSTQEAKLYRVRVSTTADFSNVIDNVVVDQTTYTPWAATYPNGPLYWKVNAIDGSDNELTESAVQVVNKTSPLIGQVTPPPGAVVTGVPLFSWNPQAYAGSYELEVYKNPDQPLALPNRVVLITGRQAALTPDFSLPAGQYGWRIRRYDADFRPGPWTANNNTELRLFTLQANPAVLITPSNGAFVPYNQLLFQWSAVNNATQYVIETNTAIDFSGNMTESVFTPMTAWAPTIRYNDGTYYWRIKALDGNGNVISVSATNSVTVGTLGGAFHPVTPYRALDSRTSTGGFNGPLGPGQVKLLTVADGVKVPASASAIVMNVTATGGTQASYLSLFPNGAPNPGTASLLFSAGQTVPNLVTVKVGVAGQVAFFNQLGTVDVIADVVGYYDSGVDPNGSLFNGIAPQRILDSRTNTGGWGSQKLGPNTTKDLQVGGVVPIPATATGVVMNVTATGGTQASYLSVFPSGAANPGTASLLFAANQTVPNLVVVGLGVGGASAGKVSFYNQLGSVNVIADVVGYFDPNQGARFHPITPVRALDSRATNPVVGLSGAWGPNSNRTLTVSGSPTSGVPGAGTGVVANVTVTGGTAASYLSLSPTPGTVPAPTANLLFGPGQTVPNAVYVQTGTNGGVDIYNQQGSVNVIMDVGGFFAPT